MLEARLVSIITTDPIENVMRIKTPLVAASISFAFLGTSQAANILVNSSFEEPALPNVRTNNLGSVPTGWSQTLGDPTWNMIRLDGAPYSSGPDSAADGSQILDINGISTIFQSFTLTSTSNITFGASFSNREAHDGSAASTVGIYDSTGATLLSNLVTVDTFGDPTPSVAWSSGQETVTNLAPGTYQFRIALNNFNNVDATFADVTTVPEPSSALLCLLGGFAFASRRRR